MAHPSQRSDCSGFRSETGLIAVSQLHQQGAVWLHRRRTPFNTMILNRALLSTKTGKYYNKIIMEVEQQSPKNFLKLNTFQFDFLS